MANKTILIGLDGGTFSVLNPFMEEGIMPFLKQFIASGTAGNLASVVPALTPPAWTTIMTGRSPSSHGILDFFRFEAPNTRNLRYNTTRNIECEMIWSIVGRHGLKATSLNFPMMVPAIPISGFIFPGWVTLRHMRRNCYPVELYDRLKQLPFFSAEELAMDPDVERAALGGCPEEEWEEWIKLHIRRDRQWFEILRYMMNEEPCDLTAVVFDGIDRLQHLVWQYIHPDCLPDELSPQGQKVRDLCIYYYSQMDSLIAEIVNLAGPETRIFMASDHGFSTSMEIFFVNAWLHQNGYLAWADKPDDYKSSNELGLGQPRRHLELIDFAKTTAYVMTPSTNGVYISVAGQKGEEGIPPENYDAFRKELADRMLQFADPDTGKSVVTEARIREDAFPGDQMVGIAPDLTLFLRDSGLVSVLKSDVLVKKRPEPIGTHHPDGIFIAAGPGIRKGTPVDGLSLLDITPILLYSLGIPVPEDLEGHVPEELFEADFIQSHPIEIGKPTVPPEQIQRTPRFDQSEDDRAKVLERLKKLGYVE